MCQVLFEFGGCDFFAELHQGEWLWTFWGASRHWDGISSFGPTIAHCTQACNGRFWSATRRMRGEENPLCSFHFFSFLSVVAVKSKRTTFYAISLSAHSLDERLLARRAIKLLLAPCRPAHNGARNNLRFTTYISKNYVSGISIKIQICVSGYMILVVFARNLQKIKTAADCRCDY